MSEKYFITFIFASILAIANAEFDENYAKQMVNFAAASFIPPQTKDNINLAQQCFEKSFPEGKWETPVQYSRKSCAGFFNDECQLVITRSVSLKMVVIAFRGTVGKDQMDHEADESLKEYVPWGEDGSFGRVNKYFYDAAENMWQDQVESYLTSNKNFTIAFTGHSLGGAIASLTALKARKRNFVDADKMTLYTFGEPRIGDSTLAKNFRSLVPESYRIIHNSDVVPHLPLCDGIFGASCKDDSGKPYHQPQEIWYNNTDLTMDNSKYRICDPSNGEDSSCSNKISAAEFLLNVASDRGADMHLHYYDHKLDEYGPKGCNSAVKFGLSLIALICLFIFNFVKF